MKTYLTERLEVTEHGELITMCGEDIQADSEQEAQQKCPQSWTVIGECIGIEETKLFTIKKVK